MLDRAESMGAKTVMPVTDFGGMVTIAMFTDPDGLLVGLVKAADPAQAQDQPGPSAGSGEPVDWFEVLGSDAGRAQRFYADLFGWTVRHVRIPRLRDDRHRAGRGIQGGLGAGEQRWATIYAHVADVEQTLASAESHGGSRVYGPRPSMTACRRAPSATRRETCSASTTAPLADARNPSRPLRQDGGTGSMCESHQSTVPVNLMPAELARNATRWPTWLASWNCPVGWSCLASSITSSTLRPVAWAISTKMLRSIPSITSPG